MAKNLENIMHQALILHQEQDLVRAAALYQSILQQNPNHPGANHFYGLLLSQQHDYEGALTYMTKALKTGTPSAAFWVNTGNVYEAQWQLEEAARCYRSALQLNPNLDIALLGAGIVAQKQGEYDRAEKHYRAALAANPGLVQGHWNLAQLLLLTGRYDEGWTEYEWRLRGKSNWSRPAPALETVRQAHRPVALVHEMGFGDLIHFIRFLPMLRERYPQLDLKCFCPPPLSRLLLDSLGRETLLPDAELLSDRVLPLPLMSVPHLLQLTPEQVSGQPYLRVGERAARNWRERLAADAVPPERLKVGLVWAGSPTHAHDRVRSVALRELAPLLEIPGVVFYSLQRGAGTEQLVELPEAVRPRDCGNQIENFADLAGLMVNLDVVATVDTAALHLAGALGVKTLALIQFSPDWRWELNGERTRWYDSVTLLRQPRLADWSSCLTRLAARVRELAEAKKDHGTAMFRPENAGRIQP